ncbi:MAG: protein TolR [Deltaproteobacteria bacterium]|nr:MAG: protein TolR [Deltaproteobacteria bacterium]
MNNKRLMSDINVTPLVDVMLVLLIIFMVTAPMMIEGVRVNLPKTTTKFISTKEEPLVLSITKDKRIYIGRYKTGFQNLEHKIKRVFEHRKNKELLLKADKAVPYGFVVKVISKIKRAGINKIGLVTEPEKHR